jgi:hypothetical protein
MSGERPLWPEGLRKERNLPPVESQRTRTPASGDRSFVPKHEAGSSGQKPESHQGDQTAAPRQLDNPAEGLGNQERRIVLPDYLDRIDRRSASEWIQPKKELLHGWDNFAELAFDMANLLPKPDDPAIPAHDIRAQDEQDLIQKHMPADEWEESVIGYLEHRGLARKIPQFKEDMQEYRKAVKTIVQEWRESGLL